MKYSKHLLRAQAKLMLAAIALMETVEKNGAYASDTEKAEAVLEDAAVNYARVRSRRKS